MTVPDASFDGEDEGALSNDLKRHEQTTQPPVYSTTEKPIKIQQSSNTVKLQNFKSSNFQSLESAQHRPKMWYKVPSNNSIFRPAVEPTLLDYLQWKTGLLLQILRAPKYVIENVLYSPAQHISQITSLEDYPSNHNHKVAMLLPKKALPLRYSTLRYSGPAVENSKASLTASVSFTTPRSAKIAENLRIVVPSMEAESIVEKKGPTQGPDKNEQHDTEDNKDAKIKVDSHSKVSADKPIYGYEAYFSGENSKSPTLIFEPQATSIASNDGVAIAVPVSRALIKKGSNTKILWKPQAVAISGARGKSHAEAELIVDYIE